MQHVSLQDRWSAPNVEYAMQKPANADGSTRPHFVRGSAQTSAGKVFQVHARAMEAAGDATQKAPALDQVLYSLRA